jgi:hypothetical protein
MKNSVKTLDVNAREWFDRINGNTYFAAQVTVNYGLGLDAGECVLYVPFQYGYGDQYEACSFNALVDAGYIPASYPWNSLYAWCRDNGVILRRNKHEAKKKVCEAYGQKQG